MIVSVALLLRKSLLSSHGSVENKTDLLSKSKDAGRSKSDRLEGVV